MKTARLTAILLFLLFALALPQAAMAATIGKITAIEGDVDVLKPGMERAAPAALQQPVSEGDIVRTKSNGKAEITFIDDSVIRLAPGSRLQITEYLVEGNKRKSGVMNLFRGKVRAVVSKSRGFLGVAFGGGDKFEVRTPTAVAGVKGTDFFVFYNMGVTGIVVKEGRVDTFNPQIPNQVVPVNAGNGTFIAENKPPSPPRPATDVEIIRHTKDTDTGEKPKEKKGDETVTNQTTADAGGDVFGFSAPDEGTAPPPTDTAAIPEPTELPSSETHPELLTDISAPVVTIAGPPPATNSRTAAFTITFNESVSATYTMGSFGATTTNTTSDTFSIASLPEGSLTLIVTATDAAGNTSSKTYSWTTDYTAAVLAFTSTPSAITNANTAAFATSSSETVTYSYTLDGAASSNTLTGLTEGSHIFIVTATDAAGNTSSTTYSWLTDYTAPTASITPKAAPATGATAAVNVNFASNETAAYSYKLDGGPLTSTGSSLSLTGIAEGIHTISYTATDAAGNTSALASLPFDLSRYSLTGSVSAIDALVGGSVTSGEVAGISNQNWGGWNIVMDGWSEGNPPPKFTLSAGGTSFDATLSNNGGYWLEIINVTSDGVSSLSGTSSLKYLSFDRLGTGIGVMTGSYGGLGNWSATDTGTYTETPLAWSGKILPDQNNAGLYSFDTWWYWLDIEGASTGLMGGVASPWSGTTAVNYMGKYDVSLGIGYGPPYLWTPEISSFNVNNSTNTTFDGGAYRGFIGGVWQNGGIKANVYSLYIDPAGNAGILKGLVAGAYYPQIGMFEANGTWTPTALTTGLNAATATYNVVSTNYSYSMTSLGDFNGAGSITAAPNDMLSATDWRYSISGQDWGVWKSIIGGDYTGPTSDIACATAGSCDTWSLSTTVNLFQTIYGTKTDGSQWSNGVLAGKTYGYGADITTTPNTWITVGETIGTFDPVALAWQAVQTGAWLDTNKFLGMIAAGDTAKLAALNIPFAEVGRANLTGTNTDWTINMNNTTFFAYSNGAAPKIWATDGISGSYNCSVCGATPALTGNGLTANLNMQTWDTVGKKWLATVNGNGAYTGTGTMNGTNVVMEGAAAGTNTGIGPGTFTGAGAGTAK